MHNVPNYFTLLLLRVINARRLARERVYPVSSARDLLLRDYESPRDLPTSFSLPFSISLDGRSSTSFLPLSVISYISSTRSAPRFCRFLFPRQFFFFPPRSLRERRPGINPRLIVTHHALWIAIPRELTLYLHCTTLNICDIVTLCRRHLLILDLWRQIDTFFSFCFILLFPFLIWYSFYNHYFVDTFYVLYL